MSEKSEIHLFIIWSKARNLEQQIVNNIQKKFRVKGKYQINWSKDNFSNNLSRFYGKNLPPNSHKEKHCGDKEFLALVVEDTNPKYIEKEIGNNRGTVLVNENTYNAKLKYREWTGGGHKIHATNDILESKKDVFLLLGKKISDFKSFDEAEEKILFQELVGTNGWKNLAEFFYVLEQFIPYVVLNFSEVVLSEKNDIDFMTNDTTEFALLINANQGGKKNSCSRYTVNISEKKIPIDIYDIESNYFESNWSSRMIKERFLNKSGSDELPSFYGLSDINLKYGLIYHAIFHKEWNEKYHEKIFTDFQSLDMILLKNLLDKFLKENKYSYIEPKDLTVNFDIFSLSYVKISIRRKIYNFYKNLKFKIRNLKIVG